MAVQNKVQRVENRIRRAILRGDYAVGSQLPAEYTFTERYHVSQRTVREALIRLQNDGLVERRHGSGTYICDIKKVTNIAIVANIDTLSSSTGFFYRQLVDEARKNIETEYQSALWVGHGNDLPEFIQSIRLMDRSILKETIGILSTGGIDELEREFAKKDISFVSIHLVVPRANYSVVLDYDELSKLGKNLLQEKGYDDFVLVHEQLPDTFGPPILRSKLEQMWLDIVDGDTDRTIVVPRENNFQQAYNSFMRLWESPQRPRAIFFHDDVICDVALRAILELGIRVPEELMIVTHANAGRTFYFPMPLVRIEFDPKEAVARAWNILRNLIHGRQVDEPVVFIKPHIIGK